MTLNNIPLLFVTSLLFYLGETQDVLCPVPYVDIGNGNCYYFSEIMWGYSDYCAGVEGADRAIFVDEKEYMEVTDYMTDNGCSQQAAIGIREMGSILEFEWYGGRVARQEAPMWREDRPGTGNAYPRIELAPEYEYINDGQESVKRWRWTNTGDSYPHEVCKYYAI